MGKKSLLLKLWLIAKERMNRAIPSFIVAKTNRRITSNKFRRNWRRDKLKTRNVKKKYGRK